MASSLEDQLLNPKYRNWVRAALGLNFLKDGLTPFVQDQTERLLLKFNPARIQCGQCNLRSLLPAHVYFQTACPFGRKCFCSGNTKIFHKKICPTNGICSEMYDKIVERYNEFFYANGQRAVKKLSWVNTDSATWTTDPWELAKCYIYSSGYKRVTSAADCDATGLLTICINCKDIRSLVKISMFETAREHRNKTLHSSTFEIEDVDLFVILQDFVDLLSDNAIIQYREASTAVENLKKLQSNTVSITTNDSIAAKYAALDALARDLKNFKAEVGMNTQATNDQMQELMHIATKLQRELDDLKCSQKQSDWKEETFDNGKIRLCPAAIGCGKYGKVFKCTNFKEPGTIIAVKIVKLFGSESNQSQNLVKALQREVRIFERLQHRNIVKYLGSDKNVRCVCLFMELVDEGSLKNKLNKDGPLSEVETANFTSQIIEGLKYLHENGIIHRDIKCANILLDMEGILKLTDFGISKELTKVTATQTSISKGTPCWMAPELFDEKPCDVKADIWSLGCTVVEMLTSEPPWLNLGYPQILKKMLKREPPTYSLLDGSSAEVLTFLQDVFKYDPKDRPSAEELRLHPFIKRHEQNHPHDPVLLTTVSIEGLHTVDQCSDQTATELDSVEIKPQRSDCTTSTSDCSSIIPKTEELDTLDLETEGQSVVEAKDRGSPELQQTPATEHQTLDLKEIKSQKTDSSKPTSHYSSIMSQTKVDTEESGTEGQTRQSVEEANDRDSPRLHQTPATDFQKFDSVEIMPQRSDSTTSTSGCSSIIPKTEELGTLELETEGQSVVEAKDMGSPELQQTPASEHQTLDSVEIKPQRSDCTTSTSDCSSIIPKTEELDTLDLETEGQSVVEAKDRGSPELQQTPATEHQTLDLKEIKSQKTDSSKPTSHYSSIMSQTKVDTEESGTEGQTRQSVEEANDRDSPRLHQTPATDFQKFDSVEIMPQRSDSTTSTSGCSSIIPKTEELGTLELETEGQSVVEAKDMGSPELQQTPASEHQTLDSVEIKPQRSDCTTSTSDCSSIIPKTEELDTLDLETEGQSVVEAKDRGSPELQQTPATEHQTLDLKEIKSQKTDSSKPTSHYSSIMSQTKVDTEESGTEGQTRQSVEEANDRDSPRLHQTPATDFQKFDSVEIMPQRSDSTTSTSGCSSIIPKTEELGTLELETEGQSVVEAKDMGSPELQQTPASEHQTLDLVEIMPKTSSTSTSGCSSVVPKTEELGTLESETEGQYVEEPKDMRSPGLQQIPATEHLKSKEL